MDTARRTGSFLYRGEYLGEPDGAHGGGKPRAVKEAPDLFDDREFCTTNSKHHQIFGRHHAFRLAPRFPCGLASLRLLVFPGGRACARRQVVATVKRSGVTDSPLSLRLWRRDVREFRGVGVLPSCGRCDGSRVPCAGQVHCSF